MNLIKVRLSVMVLVFCMMPIQKASAQLSPSIRVTSITTPTFTPCSGTGTFVLRIQNITGSAINNIVVKDSMPPGINYISGTVLGTNTTFGSTIVADNVITFNVSTIPASGIIDISWDAKAGCSISKVAANITNTYNVSWGTNFAAPLTTATYNIFFPSISIVPSNANYNASCFTPFVREIEICNGGFGSVDSITFTDNENSNSLIIQRFEHGTQTGLGTRNAKTVLKSADFIALGIGPTFDQNECFILRDTLVYVGSASSVTGTLKAVWGCGGSVCPNPSSSTFIVLTTRNLASPLQPTLRRWASTIGGSDSSGQIYGRYLTHQQIVKNTGLAVALNSHIEIVTQSMRYIDTSSILMSLNGGIPTRPTWARFNHGSLVRYHPHGGMGSVLDNPSTYNGALEPNSIRIKMGDLQPGDSVIITFKTSLAGPITRTNQRYYRFNNGNQYYCTSSWPNLTNYYQMIYGPSIGMPSVARMYWSGCPRGFFRLCRQDYTGIGRLYNGLTFVNTPRRYGLEIATFRSVAPFVNYTALTNPSKCAFEKDDTLNVKLQMNVMSLPFYTDKSTFEIKIKTNGGVAWSGDTNATYARISTASTSNWKPYRVDDRSSIDSTIRLHFRRSDCPNSNFGYYNSYNAWCQIYISLINRCPGPSIKRIKMTRIFNIDSTNSEPAIEAGIANNFPVDYNWNTTCPGPCVDGVSIINYDNERTTFGAPDNDQNGLPDATGVIDRSKVKLNRITWGDTFAMVTRMIVHSTNPAGVPSLYMKSSIRHSSMSAAINYNTNVFTKDFPRIVLIRPGVGTFMGVGTAIPTDTNNVFTSNMSLQGTGGITIPGITTYKEGDTVVLTQNLIYYKANSGGLVEWGLLHVPYTSAAINPTPPQRLKCDSIVCNFESIGNRYQINQSKVSGTECGDTVTFRWGIRTQIINSGCGTNYFPYESRNVYVPRSFKMAIPASSNHKFIRINSVFWRRIIKGGSGIQCAYPINGLNSPLPASVYTFANDTLYVDFKDVAAHFGLNYKEINLYSFFQIDITTVYNPPIPLTGCEKDHSLPLERFNVVYKTETSRPMDRTVRSDYFDGLSNTGNSAYLTWPGNNGNIPEMYLGTTKTVTDNNQVVVSIRYRVNTSSGLYDNAWLAIPNRPGITVDSVLLKSTGQKMVSVPGSDIYQLGVVAGNGGYKYYDIYTTVSLCQNDALKIYADRTPCSGYPATWAGYACQSKANVRTYSYVTFSGELQMVDSLYSTTIDMCSEDTVQFKVINSQTQIAKDIQLKFKLPLNLSFVPGKTERRNGTGAWASAADPIYSLGEYIWTMPGTDSLAPINTAPNNQVSIRVVIKPECGYVSGEQITSSIQGNVACGAITSLFNTNPPALNINGAPSLSYFTNPRIDMTQINSCGTGGTDFKVVLKISGGSTNATDSIKVFMPYEYGFFSYSSAHPGSRHAPIAQPVFSVNPDSSFRLSWNLPGGIIGGDSIIFTFKYMDSLKNNKCVPNPDRKSWVSTYINSGVTCPGVGGCTVSIANGSDTAVLQSFKPSLSAKTTYLYYNNGCVLGSGCPKKQKMEVRGVIYNNGTAAVPPGTQSIMEVILDKDNSGTINAGDIYFKPFISTAGIPIGDSIVFSYVDSTTHNSCATCSYHNILFRFSNNPAPPAPLGTTQCLCDTSQVTVIPLAQVLALELKNFSGIQFSCDMAEIEWHTLDEPEYGLTFEIQGSSDGINFKTIIIQNALGKSEGMRYNKLVRLPEGISYYRLLMNDNGIMGLSKLITLRNKCVINGNSLLVYPNPNKGKTFFIKTDQLKAGIVFIDILEANGKVVYTEKRMVSEGEIIIEINPNIPFTQGVYFVKFTNADGTVSNQRLMIEKRIH